MSSAHLLPKIIRSIRDRYPNIEFELHEGNIHEIQEWLNSRAIDVALIIVTEQEPVEKAYETMPLYNEEMLAVFRDDEPFADQEILPVKMLNQHPMIVCQGGYEVPIVDLFKRAETELHFGFVVHNVNTCLNMIEQGLGTAMLPAISVLAPSWCEGTPYRTEGLSPHRDRRPFSGGGLSSFPFVHRDGAAIVWTAQLNTRTSTKSHYMTKRTSFLNCFVYSYILSIR